MFSYLYYFCYCLQTTEVHNVLHNIYDYCEQFIVSFTFLQDPLDIQFTEATFKTHLRRT